jgi:hypothetical protein
MSLRVPFRFVKNLAALGLSLLFVAWLVWREPQLFSKLLNALASLPYWLWTVVLTGLFASYALRGARVAFEFRAFPALTFFKSLQIIFLHNAAVNFLPFRSGELAFPFLLQRVAQVPLVRSVSSLLVLRFQDACVVLMLCLAFWPGLPTPLRLALALALILAALALHVWLRSSTSQARWTQWALMRQWQALREALRQGNPQAGWSWLITCANWSIKISVQALLYAHWLHTEWAAAVFATLSTEIAAFSPIQGVAGLGTFEASGALALQAQGVPWMAGLQAATQVHFIMLLNSLFWALIAMAIAALDPQKKDREANRQ